jgi:N-acyl-D-amino-acid deacylase
LDIVIRGGTIVDGTGKSRFHADVGIDAGRIVKVSRIESLDGSRTIDAQGLVVAPGFIDIHTHSDFALLRNRKAESAVRQGITTSLLGACGRSCAPVSENNKEFLLKDIIGYDSKVPVTWDSFAEYLRELERRGVAQNVGALVGHNAVRIAIMGYDPREPTEAELSDMKDLVGECMQDGAFGLSTGLAYPPGSFASTEEVIELSRVAAEYGGIYWSHLRGSDGDFLAGVEEAIRIGKEAKLPVHMAHLCGFFGNSETQQALRMIEDARGQGLDVTCDLYPYLAGANPLAAFLPQSVFVREWKDLVEATRDPAKRKELAEEIRRSEVGSFWLTRKEILRGIVLYDCHRNQQYKGKPLADIAELKHMDPIEAILEILADEGSEMYNVGVIAQWMDERDNFAVYRAPFHMVGSDGIALAPYGDLASFRFHPRAYGTFPRVLGRYVREKEILTLEEAVYKMTRFPAQRLNLRDRGVVSEGMCADLVIFSYERVIDKSTYEDPSLYPEGVEYVIINGETVIENGQHTGRLAGRVLRHTGSRYSHEIRRKV